MSETKYEDEKLHVHFPFKPIFVYSFLQLSQYLMAPTHNSVRIAKC